MKSFHLETCGKEGFRSGGSSGSRPGKSRSFVLVADGRRGTRRLGLGTLDSPVVPSLQSPEL